MKSTHFDRSEINCAFDEDTHISCDEEDPKFCDTCFYNVDYFLKDMGERSEKRANDLCPM